MTKTYHNEYKIRVDKRAKFVVELFFHDDEKNIIEPSSFNFKSFYIDARGVKFEVSKNGNDFINSFIKDGKLYARFENHGLRTGVLKWQVILEKEITPDAGQGFINNLMVVPVTKYSIIELVSNGTNYCNCYPDSEYVDNCCLIGTENFVFPCVENIIPPITGVEIDENGELIIITPQDMFNAGVVKGEDGIQGPKGDKGDAGEKGIQGEKGDTGAQGIQGEKGADGAQGIQGVAGKDGLTTSITVGEEKYNVDGNGNILLPEYATITQVNEVSGRLDGKADRDVVNNLIPDVMPVDVDYENITNTGIKIGEITDWQGSSYAFDTYHNLYITDRFGNCFVRLSGETEFTQINVEATGGIQRIAKLRALKNGDTYLLTSRNKLIQIKAGVVLEEWIDFEVYDIEISDDKDWVLLAKQEITSTFPGNVMRLNVSTNIWETFSVNRLGIYIRIIPSPENRFYLFSTSGFAVTNIMSENSITVTTTSNSGGILNGIPDISYQYQGSSLIIANTVYGPTGNITTGGGIIGVRSNINTFVWLQNIQYTKQVVHKIYNRLYVSCFSITLSSNQGAFRRFIGTGTALDALLPTVYTDSIIPYQILPLNDKNQNVYSAVGSFVAKTAAGMYRGVRLGSVTTPLTSLPIVAYNDFHLMINDYLTGEVLFLYEDGTIYSNKVAVGEGKYVREVTASEKKWTKLNTDQVTLPDYPDASLLVQYPDLFADGAIKRQIKIGTGANSTATETVAIGVASKSTANYGIAVGTLSAVSSKCSIAIGVSSKANGENSVVIGPSATINTSADYSVSIGFYAHSSGAGGIAIGSTAVAGRNSIAIGSECNVYGENNIALGFNSAITIDDILPTDTSGILSVGSTGQIKRRIINVKDGVNDSDAATVGQLNDAILDTSEFIKNGENPDNVSIYTAGDFVLTRGNLEVNYARLIFNNTSTLIGRAADRYNKRIATSYFLINGVAGPSDYIADTLYDYYNVDFPYRSSYWQFIRTIDGRFYRYRKNIDGTAETKDIAYLEDINSLKPTLITGDLSQDTYDISFSIDRINITVTRAGESFLCRAKTSVTNLELPIILTSRLTGLTGTLTTNRTNPTITNTEQTVFSFESNAYLLGEFRIRAKAGDYDLLYKLECGANGDLSDVWIEWTRTELN